jgi:hypothetical protein
LSEKLGSLPLGGSGVAVLKRCEHQDGGLQRIGIYLGLDVSNDLVVVRYGILRGVK